MENKEQIISRIKKLLKSAESFTKIGSTEEAETFTSMATKLLLQYNLDMAEVEASNEDGKRFSNWKYNEAVSYKDNQSGDRWKLDLILVLARFNFCDVVRNRANKEFHVYGTTDNVDIVVYLYNFLSIGLLRIAQENHVKLSDEEKKTYNRYSYLKDFLIGAVSGINEKLKKEREEASQLDCKITSLIVCNKEVLNQYIQERFAGNVKKTNMKSVKVGSAYQEGFQVGKNYKVGERLTS